MAIAVAANSVFKPITFRFNNAFAVLFRLTPSGSYAAGGDVLDLKGLSKTALKQPRMVLIFGQGGHVYLYDLANKKVKTFVATTTGANLPLAEHSAAAYAATVTGDTIWAVAIFA